MLLFIDGFDHAATASHVTKYVNSGGNQFSITSSPTRTGTGAATLGYLFNGFQKTGHNIAQGTPVILGLAWRANTQAGTRALMSFREGPNAHLGAGITSAGKVFVWLGDVGTVIATGTTTLLLNSWYYIELKAVIGNTGSYELRIDGVPELIDNTGIDTQAGGTGVVSGFYIHGPSDPAGVWYIDDLYFCDGNGAINNTFLGPVKVETVYPQTDAVAAGSNAGLTPSTGTDHGAMVDEVPPNTTDYNTGTTVGVKDTYQLPTPTLFGTVLGVQTNLYVAKADSVVRKVCAVVRTGDIDFDGVSVSPLTTFSYFSEVRQQNPNTLLNWTLEDLTSLQVGMKVTV